MDFNKELIINDVGELEEGNDYELRSDNMIEEYTGIYTYIDKSVFILFNCNFTKYIFVNSVYKIKISKLGNNFICMCIKNLLTNKVICPQSMYTIFKTPINEYVLK